MLGKRVCGGGSVSSQTVRHMMLMEFHRSCSAPGQSLNSPVHWRVSMYYSHLKEGLVCNHVRSVSSVVFFYICAVVGFLK